MDEESEVLKSVEHYVYHQHRHLTRSNIIGFEGEDMERLKIDDNGYLVFSVDNVHVTEKQEEDGITTWYVSCALYFKTDDESCDIEGSTDIYQCYRCNETWCIEWYAS